MTYRRRPYLPGQVSPRAGLVLLREFGRAMERYAEDMASSPDADHREVSAEVCEALASMRESVAWWQARQRGADGRRGSVVGTSEPALGPVGGSSDRLTVDGAAESPDWLSVQQVAAELRVSESYVTRLCRMGMGLRGRKHGGVWLIDPESVREYRARRRPVG